MEMRCNEPGRAAPRKEAPGSGAGPPISAFPA